MKTSTMKTSTMKIYKNSSRPPISRQVQVAIFRRDQWLCRWCLKPVIFGPAMRYLQHHLAVSGYCDLAYWSPAFNRRDSPLLDALAGAIDHVEPFCKGGLSDLPNLVTACNKCNTSKNSSDPEKWRQTHPVKRIKSKYGSPVNWDGFSNLFLVLADQYPNIRVASETAWLKALKTTANSATDPVETGET
jgi:5-methylcytosine-specific restriction endonuclease McrA